MSGPSFLALRRPSARRRPLAELEARMAAMLPPRYQDAGAP
jgi:hypothetical protein